ncbi:MAG: hypothetical protein GY821_04335 [Gammaproteobacteria bacterium]|nr:hypothetical protein [Gammaproteobacteria bacterium]
MVIGSFNPSDPFAEVTEFTAALDSINLTRGDIDSGVYFIPAHNDDIDVDFSYALTITDPDSGLTNTISGTSLIIIDAVADIPSLGIFALGGGQDEGDRHSLT